MSSPGTSRNPGEAGGAAERAEAEGFRRELVGTAAHKIRSLLTAIEGSLPLLRAAIDEESSEAEVLEEMEENCQALCQVVDQFVVFADLSARSPTAEGGGLDLRSPRDLLRRAIGAMGEIARGRRVLISDRVPESLPLVACNPDSLMRAFIDVLSTAVTFSPVGGILVLEAKVEPQSVSITFTLEGTGIPASLLAPHPPRSGGAAAAPGVDDRAGIALLVARQILAEHAGDLRVENAAPGGKGAVIAVTLPRGPAGAHASPSPASASRR